MSPSPSYGHTYLTSYGWAGTGAGLRNGAIAKPLAIPPKKNLSGLGKDRDEAFPFWDHLFAAASKAITIKVSSDDEDEDPSSCAGPASEPLRRTTTGILSNRRPISGTPTSTSGNTTPSLPTNTNTDADAEADPRAGTTGRLSLLASAKREAAKCGLYARFFRGPVLGPDQDPDPCGDSGTSHLVPRYAESTRVAKQVGDRQDAAVGEGVTKKSKKRKSEDRTETREERKERKRLKSERRTARAARDTEREKTKVKKDELDRKDRKHQDGEAQPEQNTTTMSHSKTGHKRTRKSEAVSAGDDLGHAERTRNGKESASTKNRQHDIVLTTKKKNAKRKDTPS